MFFTAKYFYWHAVHENFDLVSHTEKSLIFRWKETQPISINGDLKLPKFHLADYTTLRCENRHYTGMAKTWRIIYSKFALKPNISDVNSR